MHTKIRAGIAAFAVTACCLTSVAGAAVSTIVTYGPNGEHSAKPSKVFLTADAGPEFIHIHWTGWGTAKAVGKGTFTANGSSVSGTFTLTGLETCKGGANRTYTKGALHFGSNAEIHSHTIYFPSYAPIKYCK